MKYILVLLLLTFSLISRAQHSEPLFCKTVGPFEFTISDIVFKSELTRISIKVKNKTIDDQQLRLSMGEYAYSEEFPNGIKSVSNSVIGKKVLNFCYNDESSFSIIFAGSQLSEVKEFNLRVGGYTLIGIRLPELTLSELNRRMMTWEEYYNECRIVKLTYNDIDEVKKAIQTAVEEWQRKGEFESTTKWQNRVNDITRQEYISKITSEISKQHKDEMSLIKLEQEVLAEKYEAYKKDILNKYYQRKILSASNSFTGSKFELKPYDADNETFLIHSESYGDILLPVPVYEAPSFKQNWGTISNNIKPEFVPNGEDVALNKLVFSNGPHKYTYDSHTVANYAITDINYNFAPIEIAEINFADVNIEGANVPQDNTLTPVIELNNQRETLAHTKIAPTRKVIAASEKSDVDHAIPRNSQLKSSNTFAVIIANERYDNASQVPYAENDGNILSKYLTNTLGLPQEHVKLYNNATLGNIHGALKHIKDLSLAFGEKLNLIFYYAGHGVPNEQTKQCMLLPIDGDAQMPETCYEIGKLYSILGELNANSVIVIMDACFSGSLRGDGMLFASRGVRIKSKYAEPKGNMVIFSASQGDETAFPYDKEQHGLFTYYLLKCLQENKGNVTLGQLSEYLNEQVKQQSVVSNGKLQTPMVQSAPNVEEYWRSWKLAQ